MALAALAAGARRATREWRSISLLDRVVLITGGSRGLGLELARAFAQQGARLALLARNGDELERARRELVKDGAEVLLLECDARDPGAVRSSVEEVIDGLGGIDVLVNNAGVIQVGPWEHLDEQDFEDSLAIHMWAPLAFTRAVVPHMKNRGGGRIVNIASIGGSVAVPHLLAYCTGKFALVGLSDGLRAELAEDGIRVTTVVPGLLRTGSHLNAEFKGRHRAEFALFAISNALPLFSIDAGRAARRIVEACRAGEARLILSPQAKLLHGANALWPGVSNLAWGWVARALPSPTGPEGDRKRTGWEARSWIAPSILTRLSDRAALRNNELAGHAPAELAISEAADAGRPAAGARRA